MNEGIKNIGHLMLFVLLSIHLGFMFLILSPTPLLFRMNYESLPLVEASLIPKKVQRFLEDSSTPLSISSDGAVNFSDQLKAKFLEFRREKFLDDTERLALDLSLVNFGSDILGMEAGAQYYFQKPLSDLTEDQWMSLIYFQAIFN